MEKSISIQRSEFFVGKEFDDLCFSLFAEKDAGLVPRRFSRLVIWFDTDKAANISVFDSAGDLHAQYQVQGRGVVKYETNKHYVE